ncbi:GFA family protein, partial [bacterium]|nr:GFA family protein [bacterium]
MIKLKGECLCGKIKYESKGLSGTIVHCHCSMCRKWHGAAFRSRIVIERKGFQWISGQEFLSNYNSSENVTKCFCKSCGSNL